MKKIKTDSLFSEEEQQQNISLYLLRREIVLSGQFRFILNIVLFFLLTSFSQFSFAQSKGSSKVPFRFFFTLEHQTIKGKLGGYRFHTVKLRKYHRISETDTVENFGGRWVVKGIMNDNLKPVPFQVSESAYPDNQSIKITNPNNFFNRTHIELEFPDSVQFFGAGEQFSYVRLPENLKKPLPLWIEEPGIGRGDLPVSLLTRPVGVSGNKHTTCYALPLWITSDFQTIFVNQPNKLIYYQIYRKKGKKYLHLVVSGNELQVQVQKHKDVKSLVRNISFFKGHTGIPDFGYSGVLGLQGGRKRVDSILSLTLNSGVAVQSVWIQDWVGKRKVSFGSRLWWNWQANEQVYPDFAHWVDSLRQKNIRVLGYINPFLADTGFYTTEALRNGYVLKNSKGEHYKINAGGFDAYLVDLFHPEAAEWMIEIIRKEMIDKGLSGWMADFAEWFPPDALTHNCKGGCAVLHNMYAAEWARINKEAVKRAGKEDDIIVFHRSGYYHSSMNTTLFWMGDQMTDWGKNDGFPSVLNAINSSALCGIPFIHSDIGGYTSVKYPLVRTLRSRELLYRWSELAAFTPFFRTHEGLNPELNFQYYSDPEALAFFARMSQIHYSLKPYFLALQNEAIQYGFPVNRPLWMEFPDDKETLNAFHQFMLGSEIIIIPVISPNKTQVKGYLPAGTWQHAFTKQQFSGNKWYIFEAPQGTPAVFFRKNGEWDAELSKIFTNFVQ